MAKAKLRIAVVGAGLGSPATAALLQDAGYEVKVYEQSPGFSRIGAGINLSPNVMRVLDRIGVGQPLAKKGARSENWVSQITFRKTAGATSEFLPNTADYLLWYAKERDVMKYRPAYLEKAVGGEGADAYDQIELPDGKRRRLKAEERAQVESIGTLGRVF